MAERKLKFQSRNTANWKRDDKWTGRIIEKGVEKIKDKDRHFMTLLTDKGQVRVFETEGLKDTMNAASVGDFVSIEHLGMVETSAGRDFRQFRTEVWEDPTAGPLPAVTVAQAEGVKGAAKRR